MSYLWIGILGSLLAATPALGETNSVAATNGAASTTAESKEEIEREFRKVMEADDDAQAEVDKWIRDNQEFAAKGAGTPALLLKRRIEERFEPVRKQLAQIGVDIETLQIDMVGRAFDIPLGGLTGGG